MSPSLVIRSCDNVESSINSGDVGGKATAKFTFINLSEPKQSKDKDLKRIVRSNAMRTYRQTEKRKAAIRKAEVGSPTSENSFPPKDARALDGWVARSETVHEGAQGSLQPCTRSLGLLSVGCDTQCDPFACSHADCSGSNCRERLVEQGPRLHSQDLIGNSMSDPFDAYPSSGSARYESYVLNHFIHVIARRYLPINPGNGSNNPLTKVWVPYAMADPVLFLATLNVAAIHLDVLHGRYSSPMTIGRKCETIRLVNARLQHDTDALTKETIGSVVMLAAMENLNGHSRDLEIHMDALSIMVAKRGGLGNLGWNGVLHMFIAWEDLLSSSMMASPPYFARFPCEAVVGDLPFPHPMATFNPNLGRPDSLCEEMTKIFEDLFYLANESRGLRSGASIDDMKEFGRMRSTLEHRLLSLKTRKIPKRMTILDYQLEVCRRGALLFLKRVFHQFKAVCPVLRKAKADLMSVIISGEQKGLRDFDLQLRRAPLTWRFSWVVFYRLMQKGRHGLPCELLPRSKH